MNDFIDGIGTASEGGLFARALEPDSGAKAPHPHQPKDCANCGTPLTGAYCHACGQQGHLHRTIGGFMHDLLHGAFHFEGKFWRTLPMLLFRPGQLTRRYVEGERARFVSPMALFLFSVFLMFAVFQMVGLTTPTSLDGNGMSVAADLAEDAAGASVAEAEAAIAASAEGAPERAQAEAELAQAQRGLEEARALRDVDLRDSGDTTLTGIAAIDNGLLAKWQEQPELMLYKMQANAYKFSWLLIPISIPFVWLLFFWKRRFKAYDHAIFITYSLSFMTLLFVAASVLGKAGVEVGAILAAMAVIPPIHLYKQLRHTYALSRFSALWRLLVLSAFIWIVIALFVQSLLLLGAF